MEPEIETNENLNEKNTHNKNEKNTHNNELFAKSLHNHRSYFVDEKYRLNFNSSENLSNKSVNIFFFFRYFIYIFFYCVILSNCVVKHQSILVNCNCFNSQKALKNPEKNGD